MNLHHSTSSSSLKQQTKGASTLFKGRSNEIPSLVDFSASYLAAHKPRIVFSLTTSPKRIHEIQPTIDSLIQQEIVPHSIQINLPLIFKRTKQEYSQTLLDSLPFLQHPLVKIQRFEEDFGPATKLIPTVISESNHNNSLIIVVDDDTVYPSQLTNIFVRLHLSYPQQIVAGNCGDDYLTNANNISLPAGSCRMFEGFAGVGYPRSLFGEDFLSYMSHALSDDNCLRSDDYTLSNYFARRGVIGITARHLFPQVTQLALGMGKDSLHELASSESNHDMIYGKCERFLRRGGLAWLHVSTMIIDILYYTIRFCCHHNLF